MIKTVTTSANPKLSSLANATPLAPASSQLKVFAQDDLTKFNDKLQEAGQFPIQATDTSILQVNLGKMCNQVCKHCHVDAGPDRKEIMSKETMIQCLEALKKSNISTVDLTGGAPEMNPNFRWFVSELKRLDKHIIVRCNLTIILANKSYHDLPDFFAENEVEVVSSLPHFSAKRTDAQRGEGVFEKSIKALQLLNKVGYGSENSGLVLNLVYNPSGAFLPSDQAGLERDFKQKLQNNYDIAFNNLYAITNLPISRFLEYLMNTGKYEDYMQELIEAFNPSAVEGVMCKNTISVGWDGYLYDCDFNQMLELKVNAETQHISEFSPEALTKRNIVVNQHCFGCTAGSGSSCGGSTT